MYGDSACSESTDALQEDKNFDNNEYEVEETENFRDDILYTSEESGKMLNVGFKVTLETDYEHSNSNNYQHEKSTPGVAPATQPIQIQRGASLVLEDLEQTNAHDA